MPISHPPGQTSENYLSATYFLDHDSPTVSHFAVEACKGIGGEREKAVSLYYAVRDGIRYDAYRIDFSREGFRASRALAGALSAAERRAAGNFAAFVRLANPATSSASTRSCAMNTAQWSQSSARCAT